MTSPVTQTSDTASSAGRQPTVTLASASLACTPSGSNWMVALAFSAEEAGKDVTSPTPRPFMAMPASATAAAHTVRPLARTDSMLGDSDCRTKR